MGVFFRLGALCARHPVRVALAALVSSLVLCLGLLQMRVQTDPHGIWVPPESVAAREQARFNTLFHPFFRVNQLIFYVDGDALDLVDADEQQEDEEDTCAATDKPVSDLVQKKYLAKMAQIQTAIASASVPAEASGGNVSLSLEDFCYRPIKGKGCLVTSPFQYWRGNLSLLENDPDIKLTTACQTTDPTLKQLSPCMDQNGVPVMRNVVFGGLARDSCHQNPDPCGEATPRARALMVTFLLHNSPDNATYTQHVEQWERDVFIGIAQQEGLSLARRETTVDYFVDGEEASFDGMKLTYMAERSVADSLVVQTKQNAFVVVISYLVMFLYVSLSLGKFTHPVYSRFGLGLTGILIVLLALGISMGVSCALFQMEVTMITLEVVPFLILAIGVDNMFILTNEFDRLMTLRAGASNNNDDMMLGQVLGETMANVGPSIVVAAVAESLAFLVGALTKIPALTSFCIVAALAVVADFALQMTWFAAALILDAKRVRARRYDLFPFIKQIVRFKPKPKPRPRRGPDGKLIPVAVDGGLIQMFIAKKYAPALLRRSTKIAVLVITLTLLGISALGFTQLQLGLEQQLAVPTDFYLHTYFEQQTKYGEAGPLAYVVLDSEVQYTDAVVQARVHELTNEVGNLREFVQLPVSSWLQTFNQWRQLRYFLRDKIQKKQCDCPEQPMAPFKFELASNVSDATELAALASRASGVIDGVYTPRLRADMARDLIKFNDRAARSDDVTEADVTPDALFYPLVKNFTQISIDSTCCQHYGLCGAQYEDDVVFSYAADQEQAKSSTSSPVVTGIAGSRLRFQVNAMKNQSMFVNSYYYMHQLTSEWSHRSKIASGSLGAAFPYALTFVYYEQYTYIQGIALQSILLALAVVLLAVFVLMDQNIRLSALVGLCVLSMTLTQIGFLYVWNTLSSVSTSINAVSVVNLLACVGLGVEFCVHTAHQFADSQKTLGVTRVSGNDHAANALATVGASIVSGITLTKFCGIGVLAFAPSMLFRVYFFRMYMGIVVLGFFHGLVLLPVLLSLFGQPAEYPDDFGSFLLSEERDDELEDERGAY
jgi:Niemann-Pick C1 protein